MPTVFSVGECITRSALRSVQIRRSDILDEMPPERQCFAPDQERCLPFFKGAFDKSVVVVLNVGWLVRGADAHHGTHTVDQVCSGNDCRAAEGVPDKQPDATSGPFHKPHRLSGVLYLVGERAVAPVAFRVAESKVVEAEHADALAGQLLADAARCGRVFSEGESVRKDTPTPNGSGGIVDDAR